MAHDLDEHTLTLCTKEIRMICAALATSARPGESLEYGLAGRLTRVLSEEDAFIINNLIMNYTQNVITDAIETGVVIPVIERVA